MRWETLLSYWPLLAEGAWTTIWLTLGTIICGFIMAFPIALARNASHVVPRTLATAFVFVFRGTPLLALLFLIYYGAPEIALIRQTWAWTLFRDPIPCAIVALSLNSAGYLTEVIAGALRAVPRGQVEAGLALGLSPRQVFRFIKVPNALRAGIRNYGNELVFILKGTSVASLVTVMDVISAANQIYFNTFDLWTPMLTAACLYLVLIGVIMLFVRAVERRFRIPGN
jgi:His/Glu/Gln/Arg/opine family amino acid ABC transporter permease subunit